MWNLKIKWELKSADPWFLEYLSEWKIDHLSIEVISDLCTELWLNKEWDKELLCKDILEYYS